MNGGVTYRDMDTRKDALAFVQWLQEFAPNVFVNLYARYRASKGEKR